MTDFTYIYDPIETDPDQLQQDAMNFIESQWPNWDPEDSHLESWLIAALARMVAEARDVASDVPLSIFRFYGEQILGLAALDDTPAVVDVNVTLTTNPTGRTITAGTMFGITDADGDTQMFEVISDRTLAAGVLTTAPTPITIRALEYGAGLNQLGGTGILGINVESIDWVNTITLTGPTSGGTDGESPEDYANRLSARLALLTPRPILARDFSMLARDIALTSGVRTRVLAIDGYNPADGTLNNERMVFLAAVDLVTGLAVPVGIKTTIDTELQAQREVNFVVNVGDPTYTTIDVTAVIQPEEGIDSEFARSNAETDLRESLQPYNWGTPKQSGDVASWIQQTAVRHQDLSTTINDAIGVDRWTSLVFGLNGGAQDASDKSLTGAAPLPLPGTIAVTLAP